MPAARWFRELSAKEGEARTATEDVRPGRSAVVNKTGQSFESGQLASINEGPERIVR